MGEPGTKIKKQQPQKLYTMKNEIQHSAPSGAIYGLGLIGAAVYFIMQATTFWMGVLGILKAIVWPAMLVYELFKHFAV